jgi:hypothetical protein
MIDWHITEMDRSEFWELRHKQGDKSTQIAVPKGSNSACFVRLIELHGLFVHGLKIYHG